MAHAVHYQGEIDGLQTEMSDGIEGSQFTLDEDLVAFTNRTHRLTEVRSRSWMLRLVAFADCQLRN